MQKPSAWPLHWLICIALAIGVLRGYTLSGKHQLDHDEAITWLAATGHQGEQYAIHTHQEPPYGSWAQSRDWQRLIKPGEQLRLWTIGRDLARHDRHPPLYFWLLHVIAFASGSGLYVGIAVNCFIDVITTVVLFLLGTRLLGSSLRSAVVCLLWLASPAVAECTFLARPYSLLTLASLAFGLAILKFSEGRATPTQTGIVLAMTALGALTHYLFTLVVAGWLLYVSVRLWPKDRLGLLRISGAVAMGYLLFFFAHPQFADSLRHNRQIGSLSVGQFTERAARAVIAIPGFFTQNQVLSSILLGSAVLAIPILVANRQRLRAETVLLIRSTPHGAAAAMVCIVITLVQLALYVAGMTPRHAMGPTYLCTIWPLLSICIEQVLGSLRHAYRIRLALMIILLLSLAEHGYAKNQTPHIGPVLSGANAVIIDNPKRGVLLPIIERLPNNVDVLVAEQQDLIANPQDMIRPQIARTFYVHVTRYMSTRHGRTEVLQLLASEYEIEQVFSDEAQAIEVYSLKLQHMPE